MNEQTKGLVRMMVFTRLVNMGFDPCKPLGVIAQAITPDSDGELKLVAAQFGYFIKDIPPEKKDTAPVTDYDPTLDLCIRLACTSSDRVALHRLVDGASMCACEQGTWFAFQSDTSVTIFSQEQSFLQQVTGAMRTLENSSAASKAMSQ